MTDMLAPRGTHRNPVTRSCFELCTSCGRCQKRGYSECPFKNTCSGRPDPEGMRNPHPDDHCRCKEGTMNWVTKQGLHITRKYKSSPFQGQVKTDTKTEDDRDWTAYLNEQREKLGDPNFDPIQFVDGSSTTDWTKNARGE